MAQRIRLLDELTANQIAAGEVIERPASVIKELVENSLDADAARIEIEVEEGGRKLIRVTDTGWGMNRDDALLCLERHATSKLSGPSDLAAIRTMGFRGEALPSIASVADVRLRTRERGALSGTEIRIRGGRIESVIETGIPEGSDIEVRRLFFNTPARRKFLRSDATELSHIEQWIRIFAIGHPEVAWRYRCDGRILYDLPPAALPLRRFEEVFGRELVAGMIPIERQAGDVRVTGWIGRAGLSRGSRESELCYVNGRCVEARSLYHGLREGYHNALMKGRHPVAVLMLELPPDAVDVNVHPAKREVRFHRDRDIRDLIAAAVREALQLRQSDPVHPIWQDPPPPVTPALPPSEPQTESVPPPLLQGLTLPPPATPSPVQNPLPLDMPRVQPQPVAHATTERSFGDLRLRILGIVRQLYIVADSPGGLVLIDQHAAHERVLFERVLKQRLASGVAPSQRLLHPVSLRLGPKDSALALSAGELLEQAGLSLREFGRDTFVVDSVPPFFPTENIEQHILDVLDQLRGELGETTTRRQLSEEKVTRAVCRMSVKANDHLRPEEVARLVEDLLACDLPYTCPHGRPTMILLSETDLEKKFGRAV
jgi:DNA mismatch repair protein MutL